MPARAGVNAAVVGQAAAGATPRVKSMRSQAQPLAPPRRRARPRTLAVTASPLRNTVRTLNACQSAPVTRAAGRITGASLVRMRSPRTSARAGKHAALGDCENKGLYLFGNPLLGEPSVGLIGLIADVVPA
jgi:hypothetical protein